MVQNLKNIFTTNQLFHFFKLATIALAITLIGLQIFCAFYFPIWRDDAFFASVAKNLASGEGYKAVFFDKSYAFHYGISTGPFVILPAALMIFIFGNHHWVPNLTNILLIWSLLIPIFILTKDVIGKERRWPFCFLTLLLMLIFSYEGESNKLFLWYLLMGEVPAALCVILAAFLLLLPQVNVKKLVIGGLFLGFAAISKEISVIASIVILIAVTIKIFCKKKLPNLMRIKLIIIPIFFFIAPTCLFELVKIISLGWSQYYDLQISNIQFHKRNGFSKGNDASAYILSLINFFGIASILLIPVTIYMLCFTYKEKPKPPYFVIATTLILCFFAYIIWWVNLTILESYRHLMVAFFCYFVGFSLLACGISYKTKLQFAAVFSFAFCLIDYGLHKSIFLPLMPKLEEQLIVTNAVKELEDQGYEIISCGNNFELEYLLPKNGNFRHCEEILENSFDHPVVLVNQKFYPFGQVLEARSDKYYGEFKSIPESILSRCNREYLKTADYSLLRC